MPTEEGSYWLHKTFKNLIAQVDKVHGQQPLVHVVFPFGTLERPMDSTGWIPERSLHHYYDLMSEEQTALFILGEMP